jgi:metallophosphoesterase (TIGR00282 family)
MHIVMLGDIVGQAGLRAAFFSLKQLKQDYKADYVVINAENADGGFGLLPDQATMLFQQGADVITTGNHIWQREAIFPMLDSHPHLLRPANYPPGNPGHGLTVINTAKKPLVVINLQGRVRMGMSVLCPFKAADELIAKASKQSKVIVIDFHAEDTMEKEAMVNYLDGRVSAVLGSHTHVQTADADIFPKGTAFLTDMGLTGSSSGVIGGRYDLSLSRHMTQLPQKSMPSDDHVVLQGAFLHIDDTTGHCIEIKTITHQFLE